ncbi:hypothetical protein D3C71_1883670 [compost metagenome]
MGRDRGIKKALSKLAGLIAVALDLRGAVADIMERGQVFILRLPVMLYLESLDKLDFLPLVQRIGNDTECILLILHKHRVYVVVTAIGHMALTLCAGGNTQPRMLPSVPNGFFGSW